MEEKEEKMKTNKQKKTWVVLNLKDGSSFFPNLVAFDVLAKFLKSRTHFKLSWKSERVHKGVCTAS
jgi:hypothetical protein